MRRLIEARYPQHGIYGEELGAVRSDADFCWVLDPIDGTKSFITGKPLFGTLIGLCHHGRPQIGVIDQCVLGERWVGIVGRGTTLNGKPVRTRGVDKLGEAMMYATTPHMFSPGFEAERFAALCGAVKRPLYGADCYAYALLASGFGADLVVEADLGLYDYTALVPVVSGAGGRISDWRGEELSIQGREAARGRVVAAATAPLHEAALALLAEGGNSVLKPHLREIAPYKPPLDGRSPQKHVLLDFNERTVPVPRQITEAIKAHIDARGLQCYPAYGNLLPTIAKYAGVRPEECMFTNGSDQGIDLVVRCCCPTGTEAIIPAPTFAMYEQAAITEGLCIKSPYFSKERGFPLEEVLSMVGPRTSLIVLSNPNNPTGTEIPREAILTILQKASHCAVLVDECYYEFMAPETSVKDEVAKYQNLFVTRTFSKTWGLPSLRLGYLMSSESNVRSLSSVRGPYDVNDLAAVAVGAAVASPEYMLEYVRELNSQAKPLLESFLRSANIDFWPSSANFIFCYFEPAQEIEAKLRAQNILVRPKKDDAGTLGLRITVGTVEQTERLISAIKTALREVSCTEAPAKRPKH